MTAEKSFRERAPECERLAEQSFRPHDRKVMVYAAERWRELADEEEATLRKAE
jgi:hypothetical protein